MIIKVIIVANPPSSFYLTRTLKSGTNASWRSSMVTTNFLLGYKSRHQWDNKYLYSASNLWKGIMWYITLFTVFFSLDCSHPAISIFLLKSEIGFLQPSLQDKSYKHTRQKVQKVFNVMVVAYLVFSWQSKLLYFFFSSHVIPTCIIVSKEIFHQKKKTYVG